MAPSRMLVVQKQEWLPVRGEVLIRTSSGWWTADEMVRKNDGTKCCGYVEKGKLARKGICHRWMSRCIGETWDSESPRRGKFRHGQRRSRICGQSQRPSAKQTEKNVERCRFRRKAFNNLGNVHGCNDECGDIHGKEFLNYLKFRPEI